MTATLLYGIPHCDTVKRARAWLAAHGVEHIFHDFKKQGVPAPALDTWVEACGWEPLLNRRGTTWRALDPVAQQQVQDASGAKLLMRAQPSVIKRPVVQWADGAITIGFDAGDWTTRV